MDDKKIQIVKKLAFDMADKLKKNELTSFELEYEDLKITVHRDAPTLVTQAAASISTAPVVVPTTAIAAEESSKASKEASLSGNIIKTPIVGTFYRSPSPGSEAFVKIGSKVKRGDVLCIVEAMKMLNEIESEFDGEVTQILVSDGDMVEFEQPIIVIE